MEQPKDPKSIFKYPKAPINFDEWPAVTVISVCFIALWIILIILLKIFTSTEKHFDENKYDLVMFKPSSKITGIGCRKLFHNSPMMQHNLKLMSQSNFDLSKLSFSVNSSRRFSTTSSTNSNYSIN